ncbi:MFS transporter [Colwellia sp. 1_MG-2023]|jgi:predicted MFS family arabinose efflux permease|uniref:MFS transporter n=1 Tax=unclassified Colwellia TaxID=196834 RepID=UPI001C08ADCD|nr:MULTISPECIES: MFS transporter [unclassified Colwellia]MBU2925053.1 MFS transporter [Colwellia sp. C2M11]MDO6651654.1 MFS transporter [Colwellia sp. 3_MG-2023]MDO6664948.1 MFS transporter [Colwellia sp. 2_MG-2023]MDO6689321.1 MFS transporter [Colwellia sp. 1_MG-2023]
MTNPEENQSLSRFILLLMTTAIAATAANLYYSQPILPLIADEYKLTYSQLGSIPAFTQFGYAFALLFISPLGDSIARRRLISILSCILVVACAVAVIAPSLPILLSAVFLIGVSANITQQLIPFAASMVSTNNKGVTLGTLMMGLTLGILLSRTISGFVGEQFGWRSVFIMSAVLAAIFGILLQLFLPSNKPQSNLPYLALIKSTVSLFVQHKLLQIYTLSGAFWFAAFNVLWATLAIYVSDMPFNYNAQEAGLFGVIALAGVIGAKSSGKWVNTLGSKKLIMMVLILAAIGFAITGVFTGNLIALIIGIVLIDFAIFSAQVANQVRVFSIDPSAQSRINGIYMLGYYLGGALGSIAGVKAFSLYQWPGVVIVSVIFIAISATFNSLAKK